MARVALLLFLACSMALSCIAQSQSPPKNVDQIIAEAFAQERASVKGLEHGTVMAETYVQDLQPGDKGEFRVAGDHYFLGRANIGSNVRVDQFKGTSRHRSSFVRFAQKISPKMTYVPEGFAQMAHPELSTFDADHYDFQFLSREILDGVNCLVFDLSPKARYRELQGLFEGRIWIEDQGYTIIRYVGDFTGGDDIGGYYFHFDSRRVKCGSGRWLASPRNLLSHRE